LRGQNAISILTLQGGHRDDVILADITQRPEKRVAVPAKNHITVLTWPWRARYMAHCAPEGAPVVSFHYYRGKSQTRDFNPAD
jgi:hypothetical protein